MRILHVVQLYYPVASGAARYFIEISERLVRDGHQVTVLATDAYDLEHLWAAGKRRVEVEREHHNGVEIIRFPVRRLPGPAILYSVIRRLMVELSRVSRSEPLLRRVAQLTPRLPTMERYFTNSTTNRFDLINATNITLDFALFPTYRFARQQNIPFICTPFVHLGEPDSPNIVRYYSMRHQLELLRRSDLVITQTDLESTFLVNRGIPKERMRQIGVGVTPSDVLGGDGPRFRNEHQIKGPIVLYIGALAYDKGAIHTIEAMQQLWLQGSTATLVLIGAPLAHFTAFYEQLPEKDRARIRLLPYAADTVKHDALAAANLLTLPSRTDSFGIVFLEAWCYKVPVVGARAGGIPNVIDDRRNGLLVDFGDVPALAYACGRLLTDRSETYRLGIAGHTKVMRELTWDHKYAQVREAYEKLASGLRQKDPALIYRT
ncbi:MAG: glycosyltransferase family 1 protein [Chloroflexi bacterium AL-W]|nr:glycosyltransferase family 1 protein [Chloroflexi bacterium AL-N1]NOK68472.1 glycosyltransferase family 1 protein [Chloroflexi bacterium AL-N10]NOK74118.1 glycosyltransferase family 1 protein [Chloroflexi bacterium AL-N5]NOK83085.1 glycosyltransferase family 1 protein [Chloroflexi bacterium AL-W]NOK90608.1 glycosyltransferase family 1 protein [Chloroflexi bacterium AL-N15]